MKIRPEIHAERRTEGHDEANNRFSQFLRTRLKLKKKETNPIAREPRVGGERQTDG